MLRMLTLLTVLWPAQNVISILLRHRCFHIVHRPTQDPLFLSIDTRNSQNRVSSALSLKSREWCGRPNQIETDMCKKYWCESESQQLFSDISELWPTGGLSEVRYDEGTDKRKFKEPIKIFFIFLFQSLSSLILCIMFNLDIGSLSIIPGGWPSDSIR